MAGLQLWANFDFGLVTKIMQFIQYEQEYAYWKDLRIIYQFLCSHLIVFYCRLNCILKPYYLHIIKNHILKPYYVINVGAVAIVNMTFVVEIVFIGRIFDAFWLRGYLSLKYFFVIRHCNNFDSVNSGICRITFGG